MNKESEQRFSEIFKGTDKWFGVHIIRDKVTGVNYIVTMSNNAAGGITVLVDKDGKPIVT